MSKLVSNSESGLIKLNGAGIPFSISRSKKRKRTIAFKMEYDGSLRVLAPILASRAHIVKVLEKRASWIMREHAARKKDGGKQEYSDGAVVHYLGFPCVLRVTQGQGAVSSCALSRRVLHVHVGEADLSPENLRQEVRLEIFLWIKKRAREKLKKRLDYWAKKLDVKYRKLVVTNPERRWGSCSRDNVIRLNWRLMTAPLPILDYVVAHELCHIRHKDHSARFWNFLAQAMPDYKTRRKTLRHVERRLVM